MSSLSKVIVNKLPAPTKHPYADKLECFTVEGFNVISQAGTHKEGDLVAYIKPDIVVDLTQPETNWLPHERVKAVKLRGLQSYGIIVNSRPHWVEGQDVTEELNCKPYVPEIPVHLAGDVSSGPAFTAKYTDIENFRKYHHLFIKGERVVIQEKIDGGNFRICFQDKDLHVGSHNIWLKESASNAFWRAANKLDLRSRLEKYPDKIFYGELIGHKIQKLGYDYKPGEFGVKFFDIFDIKAGRYLDYFYFIHMIEQAFGDWFDANLIAPQLWNGAYDYDETMRLCEGKSTLANHIREGIVIRPVKERYNSEVGRVILKLHNPAYLEM